MVEVEASDTGEVLVCLDHNMDNGRRLKNQNSIRTVPLHPEIAGEFVKYAEKMKAKGSQRLFPELTKANGKFSHQFSKSFMGYLRNKVKITDPKKNFHSLRHTATDTLWKAMVRDNKSLCFSCW